MSDHYRTLGLQPNASKVDVKNAYFRLAHRYHPDHHAKADRAAAAAAFRRVKDAYDVLYDDDRRALYDRTSSYASSGSSGFYTAEREAQENKSKAEREAREKVEREKALREALEKKFKEEAEAQEKIRKAKRAEWDAQEKKSKADKAKREAEFVVHKKKWEVEREKREADLESSWKVVARERDRGGISSSPE